ncbi:MAG: hypothetical protein HYX92_18795 [Chloroflexi bacterium]|nr:hypothetical protein [Chloroflexota bacterium]
MSLNDAVLFEKRGIPTAMLAAGRFSRLGQLQAKALGIPWLPIVVMPYPFGSLLRETVQNAGDEAVDEIIHILTQPAEKLEKDYLDRHVNGPNPLRAPGAPFKPEAQ